MSDQIDDLIDALVDLIQAKIEDARPDHDPSYIGYEHTARDRVRKELIAVLRRVR